MVREDSRSAPKNQPQFASDLLAWYDVHRRRLPWRALPDERPDPYRVWLSEIMLQQTTVATVTPRYARFLERWPTVEALAAAPLDDVLSEWAGLGYYARARNLHKCAIAVAEQGGFPQQYEALKALPGIGDYTAGAIAAIAFDEAVPVVDGNVERVIARLDRLKTPLPKAKPLIKERVEALLPTARPGDFAQAMMDLGATVCKPRNPECGRCPILQHCAGYSAGDAADYPKKLPKKAKPTRKAYIYWLETDGQVLVERRPERGLLGGMLGFPASDWAETLPANPLTSAPIKADWCAVPGLVRHSFTHFHFEMTVLRATWTRDGAAPVSRQAPGERFWLAIAELDQHALPTVMMKVARHVEASKALLV